MLNMASLAQNITQWKHKLNNNPDLVIDCMGDDFT